jgi:hypothetical protein
MSAEVLKRYKGIEVYGIKACCWNQTEITKPKSQITNNNQ